MRMTRGFWKKEPGVYRAEILFILVVLASCAWLNTAAATEVYSWTDESGTVNFSDRPPANDGSQVINVEDAYRPGTTGAYPLTGDNADAPSAPAEAGPAGEALSAAQQRREEIAKAREERKEAQAEKEQMCGKHRKRLDQMEPARRVFYINERGEEIRMDDDQRMKLIDESKDYIATNCK